ncbi:hypothetical protein Goari_027481 [Gossypium aridum]|uniref:aminocyclopropanecarboxylate oxidase n=1 Tax=Gossypium aridum TaxID=34290 RepID=A0A7J8YVC7_GOSAI|nr:hypothetical protein [Gossypium aridum]
MAIPVIDLAELHGDKRSKTMTSLHEACEKWGFFQVDNHGVDKKLMEKVKEMVNGYYDENLKEKFYESEMSKSLNKNEKISDMDWESTFFICHRPDSNINQIPNITKQLCETMEEYIAQLIKLAETLSELICENLGLDHNHIKQTFCGTKGPSIGTKVAIYPQCPNPDLVRGLREHTDAGGIILLLQDDQVPGLEFLKDGQWFRIPPSKNNTIFVNTGDQIEVISNGKYKSVLHRVMAEKQGNRLSIATFYNPGSDAVISPAPELLYPGNYQFGDYLKLYSTTKFLEKGPRFESMKTTMVNGHHG